MFQSSMNSSSGSSLFTSLLMLLILNILIIFNISNIDKEVNKEFPEDDLIENRNMLKCFLKVFKVILI